VSSFISKKNKLIHSQAAVWRCPSIVFR